MFTSPKIIVYFTRIENELPIKAWRRYINEMPEKLQQTISSYKCWKDRHRSLFGKLLLLQCLLDMGYSKSVLFNLQYSKYGRPSLNKPFDFNISHSGDLVLCAIADQCRVGVDVEKIREFNLEELRNTMTCEQWKNIYFAESPEQVFFQYWTMKESVIKANGKGLLIPLNQLEAISGKIIYEGDCWYVKELQFDQGHAAYIATEFKNFNVKMIDLRF